MALEGKKTRQNGRGNSRPEEQTRIESSAKYPHIVCGVTRRGPGMGLKLNLQIHPSTERKLERVRNYIYK